MFAAGIVDVFQQSVLIVEDDEEIAALLAKFVSDHGGLVVGPFANAKDAMRAVEAGDEVDSAMVGADLPHNSALPLVRQLKSRAVIIVWIVGYDGWFIGDGGEDVAVYRLAGDPENVMRISLGR